MVGMDTRPSTVTLLKPVMLDTKLLGIFDMSTLSREHLLAICKLVSSTPRREYKTVTGHHSSSVACRSTTRQQPRTTVDHRSLNKTWRVRKRGSCSDRVAQPARDECSPAVRAIPIPCATCGRLDQPERFHSHPGRLGCAKMKTVQRGDERKTVQKPIAIKFKSASSKEITCSRLEPSQGADVVADAGRPGQPERETRLASKWKRVARKALRAHDAAMCDDSGDAYELENWTPAPVSRALQRKIVCYLCSQEFGTAAMPCHEAQCIRKYVKKNDHKNSEKLNISADRQEQPMSTAKENWKLSWEVTKASLITCPLCDRKFLPNRLEAHERICASKSNVSPHKKPVISKSNDIFCEYCGKWFISDNHMDYCEHIQKCEKINEERDLMTGNILSSDYSYMYDIACYICGQCFSSKMVRYHELQCLKNWLQQHEKLPLNLRNSLSVRYKLNTEDIISNTKESVSAILTDDSQELFWKAHQAQLVPCEKCSRRFYPHRLTIHMKGCKGNDKKVG